MSTFVFWSTSYDEIRRSSDAFKRGYWDAFTGHDADPPLQASDRVEYRRGYRAGDLDRRNHR